MGGPLFLNHLPTAINLVADHAIRSVPAARLKETTWLTGLAFLTQSGPVSTNAELFDSEIHPQVSTLLSHSVLSASQVGNHLELLQLSYTLPATSRKTRLES